MDNVIGKQTRQIDVKCALLLCDSEGRILWMSEGARPRLDDLEPPAVGIRRFLQSGAETSATALTEAGWVRLSRLLGCADHSILFAESGEREDPAELAEESLVGMERSLTWNYFRLQKRAANLHPVRRRRRSAAAIWTERMEELRASIGRELHVGAGQSLAGIRLHLEVIRNLLAGSPPEVQSGLERIGALADDALSQVRAVAHRLHPPDWQSLTLRDALESLWSGSGIPQKYQSELRLGPLTVEPAFETKVVMYRAAQEAISNLIRHSGCGRAGLTLEHSGGRLRLTVEDDGRGFDADALLGGKPQSGQGIGLRDMRAQVRRMGGKFSVESGPKGTKLSVDLPL